MNIKIFIVIVILAFIVLIGYAYYNFTIWSPNPKDLSPVRSDGATDRLWNELSATSSNGTWRASVDDQQGHLNVQHFGTTGAPDGPPTRVATRVVSVLISPDNTKLVYMSRRENDFTSFDMFVSPLPLNSSPRVIDYSRFRSGSISPVAISPDSRSLIFGKSNEFGITALWIVELDDPDSISIQLTNRGVRKTSDWIPGTDPAGFVPPPVDRDSIMFDGSLMRWSVKGVEYSVEIPN
tara:strand:+ start:12577 stop:13287 length:711 start_codon:yes stop_codon:yes gene_type:complete